MTFLWSRRVAVGVVLALAGCGLAACGSGLVAGGRGLAGRMSGTSDVAGQPGGEVGGSLAAIPAADMARFWEVTGTGPVDEAQWPYLSASLSGSELAELHGARAALGDDGDFRLAAPPGPTVVCYLPVPSRITGCGRVDLPRAGTLVASWGEAGFHIRLES